MVMMPGLPTLPSQDSTPQDDRLDRRRRQLLDARAFRLEQLAAGDEADPRQGGVQRALHMAATTALAEIDAALDRMERGVYGQCLSCARPIPEDRLDALPMAPRCMPCHYNEENCRLDRRS